MSPDYQFLSWWLWEYLYFILLWSSNRKYRSINRNCLGFCHETMVYSLVYMYVLLCCFFLKCYTKTKFPSFVCSHLNCYEMIFGCDVLTRMVKVQLFSSVPQTALLPPLQWTWMGPLECPISKQMSLPPFIFLEAIRHIRHFLIDKVFKETLWSLSNHTYGTHKCARFRW